MLAVVILLNLLLISYAVGPPQRPHQGRRFEYQQNPKSATIVQQENNNTGLGNYYFLYQTSDGMSREEKAELKNVGTEKEALVVQGSYSYVGSDGVTYTVSYIADENGFRPTGEHIPKTNNV